MTRLLSAAAVLVLAAVALIPTAAANNGTPTHLSDEPAPLNADTDVVFFHDATPPLCTPLSDGFCLERAERWLCPAGLSSDAVTRRLADLPYNAAIAAPPVAYLDTHCVLEHSAKVTVAEWVAARYGISPPGVIPPGTPAAPHVGFTG